MSSDMNRGQENNQSILIVAVKNSISSHVLLTYISNVRNQKLKSKYLKFNFTIDVLCLKRRASSLLVPTGLSANLLQFKSLFYL